MQKLIIIRGHPGSGKSTFAQEKLMEFKTEFPNAQIFHIENDKFLEQDGKYHWTKENFKTAKINAQQALKQAFHTVREHPKLPICIIISNVGINVNMIYQNLNTAKKLGMHTEIYRMQNFFTNVHNVSPSIVYDMYIEINQRPIEGEIFVAPIKPIDPETAKRIEAIQNFPSHNLPKNEKQNTYVTQEYLDAMSFKKRFTIKESHRYPELRVLKYTRQVFFNNLWDNVLLEMRGLVIDQFTNIIVRPFKKCFNYSERIAKNSKYPLELKDNEQVNAVIKINGFLGCCTYVDLAEQHPSIQAKFNKKILFSTTGSLDSDYAHLVEQHCKRYENLFKSYPNHTFLFEICDPSDPHIIKEQEGEVLIGCIDVQTGNSFSEQKLNMLGEKYHIRRPLVLENITFGELKKQLKEVKHEGFMVFNHHGELLCKIKSPYYLISKFFARSTSENLSNKLNKRQIDEEYYPLIDHIKQHQEQFEQLSEQEKIQFIQTFLTI